MYVNIAVPVLFMYVITNMYVCIYLNNFNDTEINISYYWPCLDSGDMVAPGTWVCPRLYQNCNFAGLQQPLDKQQFSRHTAQCLMTQTSRNLSTFNIASLMPFFRLITPFLYFYRWFLRQNDVYMQKVPWFFKLKFSAELCRGPGPAGCRTATRRQGHTHTPATTITGDYVAK